MLRFVDIHRHLHLDAYAADLHLQPSVEALRATAAEMPGLQGRTVYAISSTAKGGGVAEMLPSQIGLLRDLGIDAHWIVIEPAEPAFFELTKRLHNAIHGGARPAITAEDRELYARVSRDAAAALAQHVTERDLLLVHDPQPAGAGSLVQQRTGAQAVWRCHIGLDEQTDATRDAWEFLRPWLEPYDRCVFSVAEYAPEFTRGRAVVIPPGIDPLSHKNRELSVHKLTGILQNAGLVRSEHPVLYPPFDEPARRLGRDGSFHPAHELPDVGLLFRPIVTQVSRWDRLKGFGPLLEGFVRLKREGATAAESNRAGRRLQLTRLVLAGPDPESIADDPEGKAVLEELKRRWLELDSGLQEEVALLSLPMGSLKHNALIVNALQRCSTIVVQNSLREGFGLTVTEAMNKGLFVIGTHAAGLRAQIEHGVNGWLTDDPEEPDEIRDRLRAALGDPMLRINLGRNARRRVGERFLSPVQLRAWLLLLQELLGGVRRMDTPVPPG
ncbi:MAG: glycosyltransferase [Myxococcales bacterium]|jgi:trehalose synthase